MVLLDSFIMFSQRPRARESGPKRANLHGLTDSSALDGRWLILGRDTLPSVVRRKEPLAGGMNKLFFHNKGSEVLA